jgi:uncharacterized protein
MKIWMDGDACPKPIKEILFRTAIRTNIHLIIVANHIFNIPASKFITFTQVTHGFDAADQYIVDTMQMHDLVITADLPLADAVVSKGGLAINPRGELYSANNIKQLLAARNHNESLRGAGIISGGPSAFNAKDIQKFANQLDRLITRNR